MPLTMDRTPVAEQLKQKTHVRHLETEALIGPRLSSITTYDDYAAVLRIFYGFYHPLEQQIARCMAPQVLEDIHERRTSNLIPNDLKAIGQEGTPALCTRLPAVRDVASALGALYVLEGSTLGGRVIKKMLLKNPFLQLNPEQLTFFNGYGEATGDKWKSFQACLNRYQPDAPAITASADETFLHFSNWIRQYESDHQLRG